MTGCFTFEESAEVFKACTGPARYHGLTALALLKRLCELVDVPETKFGDIPKPAAAAVVRKPRLADIIIAPVEPDGTLSRWQTGEKRLMVWALETHGYQQKLAARFLDIPASSFHDKARRYGILK